MATVSAPSSSLQAWIRAFGTDYVSVTLQPQEACSALGNGLVKPPEERLRSQEIQDNQVVRDYFVEEKGESTSASVLVPSVEKFREKNKHFKMPVRSVPVSILVKAEKEQPKSIEVSYPEWNARLETVYDIAQRARITPAAASVLYDMMEPPDKRIYFFLATEYQRLRKEIEDPQRAFNICEGIKNAFFNSLEPHCQCQLAATYNGVKWKEDGLVVILKGHGKKWIGCRKRDSDYLLAPWQNGGPFFNLDLTCRDIFVVGPKATVDPHNDVYACATLENLTTEQQDFFQVPARLRGPIKV